MTSGGPGVKVPKTLDLFDPRRSVEIAREILGETCTLHALIGRLAVWAYVPMPEQRMTKDVDFAVPTAALGAIEAAARARGLEVRPLRIGGCAVRSDVLGIRIDFIDRRFDGVGPLFEDAIREAPSSGVVVKVGAVTLPVVSCEHLLAMKMVSGEPTDDEDARALLRRTELDYRVARALVARFLGPLVAGRLDVLARDAGRPEVPVRGEYES